MIDFREKCHGLALLPALLIMVCCALGAGQARAAQEETYPLLQIGTITYTNVTVTTKAKKYIFVLHSTGMANIRVADLPPDIRKALGYTELEQKDKANVAKATAWAREALSRFSTPQVMAMEEQVQKGLRGGSSDDLSKLLSLNKGALFAILGLSLAIFLFFSYCCMLICK